MLHLGSCNPLYNLPYLARLSCTIPFLMEKNPTIDSIPISLNTTPVAKLCATGAGQTSGQPFMSGPIRGTIVGLPELVKLIGDWE